MVFPKTKNLVWPVVQFGLENETSDNSWCLVSSGKLFPSNVILRQSSLDTEWVSRVYLSHFTFCCRTASVYTWK